MKKKLKKLTFDENNKQRQDNTQRHREMLVSFSSSSNIKLLFPLLAIVLMYGFECEHLREQERVHN